MNEGVLFNLAEVSVTLAGFSGIAVVLSLRWTATELRVLWFLVANSLLAVFLALLPIPMALADWDDDVIWTVCALLLGTWFIVGNALALLGDRRDWASHHELAVPMLNVIAIYGASAVSVVMGVALWLSAFDLGVPRGQAIYVAGLIVLIAHASIEFLFFIGLASTQRADQDADSTTSTGTPTSEDSQG